MNCAREGVIPILVDHLDYYMACGNNGLGANTLGLTVLELGNQFLKARGEKPALNNPSKTYQTFQKSNQEALTYHNLIQFTEADKHHWILPRPQAHNTLRKELPTQQIQRQLAEKGCIGARTVINMNKPHQIVLQLRFSNIEDAVAFKNNHCGGKTQHSEDGKTIIIGALKIPDILSKLGIYHYGTVKPVSILEALHDEHQQKSRRARDTQFFKPFRAMTALSELIALTESLPANQFSQILIHHLQDLSQHLQQNTTLNDSSILMSKIQEFTSNFTHHTLMRDPISKQLIQAILDPQTEKLCDLNQELTEMRNQSPDKEL